MFHFSLSYDCTFIQHAKYVQNLPKFPLRGFTFFPLISQGGARSYLPNHSTVFTGFLWWARPWGWPSGKETGVKPLLTPSWTSFCNITNVAPYICRVANEVSSKELSSLHVLLPSTSGIKPSPSPWLVAVLSINRLTESLGVSLNLQDRWCSCPHCTKGTASQEFPITWPGSPGLWGWHQLSPRPSSTAAQPLTVEIRHEEGFQKKSGLDQHLFLFFLDLVNARI